MPRLALASISRFIRSSTVSWNLPMISTLRARIAVVGIVTKGPVGKIRLSMLPPVEYFAAGAVASNFQARLLKTSGFIQLRLTVIRINSHLKVSSVCSILMYS